MALSSASWAVAASVERRSRAIRRIDVSARRICSSSSTTRMCVGAFGDASPSPPRAGRLRPWAAVMTNRAPCGRTSSTWIGAAVGAHDLARDRQAEPGARGRFGRRRARRGRTCRTRLRVRRRGRRALRPRPRSAGRDPSAAAPTVTVAAGAGVEDGVLEEVLHDPRPLREVDGDRRQVVRELDEDAGALVRGQGVDAGGDDVARDRTARGAAPRRAPRAATGRAGRRCCC